MPNSGQIQANIWLRLNAPVPLSVVEYLVRFERKMSTWPIHAH